MEGSPKKYRVIQEYTSPYPDPIIFHRGDIVKIVKEFADDPDWKDWIWCEGKDNKKAWVPKQYIAIEESEAIFRRDYNAMELNAWCELPVN